MDNIKKQKDRVNSIVSEIKRLSRLRTENIKGIEPIFYKQI